VDLANEYAVRAIAEADPDCRAEMESILKTTETAFGRKFDDISTAVEAAVLEAKDHLPLLRTGGRQGASTSRTRGAVTGHSPVSGFGALAGQTSGAPERDHTGFGVTHDGGASHAALEILAEITRAILGHENINDTLAMVLEGIARTGGFEIAFLALLNGRKDHLVGRLGWGEGVAQYLAILRVPLVPGGGVLAEAMLERQARVLTTGGAAALAFGDASPAIAVESLIVHPLIVRGKAIGIMVAARTSQRPTVGPADVTLAQLFCNQAGLALDRAVV
jgi:GAF domain-containing protein